MDNTYKTNDFALSSALLALNFKITGTERINDSKVLFYFDLSDELLRCVEDYWQDALLVNPKVLYYAQKEIKSRIYAVE